MASIAFTAEAQAVAIGQGCSALTFPMPDSRLSALTAGLSETLIQRKFPLATPTGKVYLAKFAADGLSQSWIAEDVPPWIVVRKACEETWRRVASLLAAFRRLRTVFTSSIL
jgi:hypothetical protein